MQNADTYMVMDTDENCEAAIDDKKKSKDVHTEYLYDEDGQ